MWVKGPAGAVIPVVPGVHLTQEQIDRKVASGEWVVVPSLSPEKSPKAKGSSHARPTS